MRLNTSGEVPKVMTTLALFVRRTPLTDAGTASGQKSAAESCRYFTPRARARKPNFDACDPITTGATFIGGAKPVAYRSRLAPNVVAVPPEASGLREKFDCRHMCHPSLDRQSCGCIYCA